MAQRALMVGLVGLLLLGCERAAPPPAAPAQPPGAPALAPPPPPPPAAVEVASSPEAQNRPGRAGREAPGRDVAMRHRAGPEGPGCDCPFCTGKVGGGMGGPGARGTKKFGQFWPMAGLYPPRLVLHQGEALGLSVAQVAKIKQDVFDTDAKVIDLRARAKKARLEVAKLLAAPKVDQQAVNRRIDEAAAAQAESRKARLGLLLRTRDALTPEQRTKLDQTLKQHGGMHGGMGPGRPGGWNKDPDPERGAGPRGM